MYNIITENNRRITWIKYRTHKKEYLENLKDVTEKKIRINSYRRTATLCVKSYANEEDIRELIKIYNEKKIEFISCLMYNWGTFLDLKGKMFEKYLNFDFIRQS